MSNVEIAPLLDADEVEVSLTRQIEVPTGQNVRSELLVCNRRSRPVTLRTNGILTARVIDPRTEEVVGGFVGWHTAPLVVFNVAAGESVTVPLLLGTCSMNSELGDKIAPGDWTFDVVIDIEGEGRYRTPPLPLRVTT